MRDAEGVLGGSKSEQGVEGAGGQIEKSESGLGQESEHSRGEQES